MSYEKYSDISKDTQDKIGQLSLGQWTKDRQGKASFSGGGEMSDWLQIMVNRGGYSQEGALKTLQNIKGPVELAVLLKSLQKSAKLTESEFTALAETINDFSYLAKSVDSNGQNVIDTMNMMINSGLALNSQQQKSIDNLSQMSIVFDNARNSLGDQFAASFSKGLEDLGINTQNLSSEMGSLVPLVKDLGTEPLRLLKVLKTFWMFCPLSQNGKIGFSELINQRNRIFSSKAQHLLENRCCRRVSLIWQAGLKI